MPGAEAGLAGRAVVITRPAAQASGLADRVRDAGGTPWLLPALETVAAGGDAVRKRLNEARQADLCIFVSRNAVTFAMKACPVLPALLAEVEVYAVGEGTRMALANAGINAAAAGHGGSDALLAEPRFQRRAIAGERVLIVRGVGGRERLRNALAQRGARVDYAEVYQRRRPAQAPAGVIRRWRNRGPDVIVITSNEALHNLEKLLPEDLAASLARIPLVVMSERIANHARESGYPSRLLFVAPQTSDAGLMQALLATTRPTHESP